MTNRVKFYHLWETKHVLLVIVGILLLALIVFFRPISHYYKYSKYDQQVNGQLLDLKTHKTTTQGFEGGKETVHHYSVKFAYEVDGKSLTGSDDLEGTQVNGYKLNKILSSAKKNILVRYQAKAPTQSVVDIR